MTVQQITEAVKRLSTDEAAGLLKIKAQSMRAALSRDGHYQGARPMKARNRFLLWNAVDIEQIAQGRSIAAAAGEARDE